MPTNDFGELQTYVALGRKQYRDILDYGRDGDTYYLRIGNTGRRMDQSRKFCAKKVTTLIRRVDNYFNRLA